MHRILLAILLFCNSIAFAGDPISVGIFNGANYTRVTVTILTGQYILKIDGDEVTTISAGQSADVSVATGKLTAIVQGKEYKSSQKIIFQSSGYCEFKVQAAGQKANGRIYSENLHLFATGGRLQLVNRIDVENYVPGVIEAEGGGDHEIEYYKVQAIISRTYALNNLRRHEAEGFSVCDGTHCQVYHGRPRHEPLARQATEATEDIVIVDDNIDLITAAFHSNCGGHTVNAEDVWSKPLSYCVARPDSFCTMMPHSHWEKSMPSTQWYEYIQSKKNPVTDSTGAIAYVPNKRSLYLVDSSFVIPTRTIRQDLKLRSAYFTVHDQGEQVKLMGQGFGHGVGLCQEGAMRMAVLGYTYKDIIHYYYKGVHLVPRRLIWFFKED